MQRDTCPSHKVDQAVDCGLWNVVPLLFNGCAEVYGYWREMEHTLVQVDLEHPKHAQWLTCMSIVTFDPALSR